MRAYDSTEPLIFIHIPKAAGTSVRKVFGRWFGRGLHEHYFNEERNLWPPVVNLPALAAQGIPLAVYGHFNRLRGFGVEHDYPDVRQFITILRDPFEATISSFHYLRRSGSRWQDQSRIPQGSLREYMLRVPPNLLNHFPRVVTRSNYREQIERCFVEVGIMERLPETMRRIAAHLGRPFSDADLPHENATAQAEQPDAELRDLHLERYPLEHEVYRYALMRFERLPAAWSASSAAGAAIHPSTIFACDRPGD